MKTSSIRKVLFHASLVQRSMRAKRKPSVKVVNLSCSFIILVTGIDQQPCESPDNKSPFLQEEAKKIWFIVEENHLCPGELWYGIFCSTTYWPFFIWDAFCSHIWGWPAQLDPFWEKLKMNEQSTAARRESIDQWGISTIDVFLFQTESVKCMTSWAETKDRVIIIPSLRMCIFLIIRASV